MRSCVAACRVLLDNVELLNELDRHGGDGDSGTTFAQGANGFNHFLLLNTLPSFLQRSDYL